MDIRQDAMQHITALNYLKDHSDKLEEYKVLIKETLRKNGTVFVAGNGGSATDSAHLVGEIVGKFMIERNGYSAVDLSSNNSVITAIGNDYSYDDIFSRQLGAMAKEGDLFICFSTSGNSKNLVNALEACALNNIKTISILGKDGGIIKAKGNNCLIVKSESTPVIQVIHTFILHQLAYAVDDLYLEESNNEN
jgi:D-sedoheptulose 7-phosphate isomerase